ncbi:MAG: sigma 54-interacting transcriptional regulator [Myxococcaceae bacterium]|nr:sigma 54-interacting transcriptional regulator [Myxococcaceae bacterium]
MRETLRRTRSRGSSETPALSLTLWHRDGTIAVPLAASQSLVVGREVPSDIVVPDPSLSRQHARFSVKDGAVEFEDLGSTNGVFRQGKQHRSGRFSPGETLLLGDVAVVLHEAPLAAAWAEGLESHERFAARVEHEERRARAFSRTFALLMVRGRAEVHSSALAAQVRPHLRDVDVLAAYGPSTLELLLPEAEAAAAESLARKLSATAARPSVGFVTWPADAGAAPQLLTRLREATFTSRPGAVAHPEGPAPQGELVYKSDAMRRLLEAVAQVAASDLPVLVHGETGTGKELVARAVHAKSPRAKGPLKALNCAALPATLLESALFGHEKGAFTGADKRAKGIFEQADGGTVFLDEIGELSPAAQAALLRVLETKTLTRVGGEDEVAVDVRVVAATHKDLDALSQTGAFRVDLLFRLNALTLEVPSLRERPEDLELLATHFLEQASTHKLAGFHPAALEALARHGWPGNVRELRNVVERAAVMARGDAVGLEDLPPKLRGAPAPARPTGGLTLPPVDEALDYHDRLKALTSELERGIILDALQQTGGNQTAAAERLKLPLRTLTHKLQALGIKKKFG